MRQRHGAALVLVLFAISLTSALSVGGVYLSRSLLSASRATVTGADLHLPAEGAIVAALASWDTTARREQPAMSVARMEPVEAGRVSVNVWITRFGEHLFWLQAESSARGNPMLRRRVGLVISTREGAPKPVSGQAWSAAP